MGTQTFIFYDSDLKLVRQLPNDLSGELFNAIAEYRLSGTKPDFSNNITLKILFSQIKEHIDLSDESYRKICERNAKVAKSRWEKKNKTSASPEEDSSPTDSAEVTAKTHQKEPKLTTDTKSTKVCLNENEYEYENEDEYEYEDEYVCVYNDTHGENTHTDKKAYGTYHNIFLTDAEYLDLTKRFPVNIRKILNSMSSYLKSSGKTYNDYYVRLLSWKLLDDTSQSSSFSPQKPKPSYDLDLFTKKAIGLKYVRNESRE